MDLIGRYIQENETVRTQLLYDHVMGVALRAKSYSSHPNLKDILCLLGLLHDTGKASKVWQENILKELPLPSHSKAGMVLNEKLWEENFSNSRDAYVYLMKDVISYTCGAHHGLFDCLRPGNGQHGIDEKVKSERDEEYIESTLSTYQTLLKSKDIQKQYRRSIDHATKYFKDTCENIPSYFEMGFFTRVLLSMLLDADWSDAAAFSYDTENRYVEKLKNFSWDEYVNRFELYIQEHFTSTSDINLLRTKISDECKTSAKRDTGIYTLSVPTGSGKTIAAMRFALHHAKKHKKNRIFYIAPYISILEQNAKVYKNMLSKTRDDDQYILEYHSNVINDFRKEHRTEEESEIMKYLGENFSAPIVLTTMVQFLNSLFSARKQSLRRLHRFQNAVMIIDEIQSIPIEVLSLLHLAINALHKLFNTTFVICSATIPHVQGGQDSRSKNNKSAIPINYENNSQLTANYDDENPFQRVEIESMLHKGVLDQYRLSNFVIDRQKEYPSILIIANTRKAAKKIYDELKHRNLGIKVYHLSNNMCANHRFRVLKQIRSHDINDHFIVVSTNLIEAGVDISVSSVIRSLTKLDSIIQAMGRCNRHGEFYKKGKLYIVQLEKDLENTKGLKEVHAAKEVMQTKLYDFAKRPERYENNLLSEKMTTSYYQDFLTIFGSESRYKYDEIAEMLTDLVDLLSSNEYGLMSYRAQQGHNPNRLLNQAFKSAGEFFQVIDNSGIGILVPYGEGKEIIATILSQDISVDEKFEALRKAQQFTINVYENTLKELVKGGMVYYEETLGVCILHEGYYQEDTGLDIERQNLEDIIF